MLRLARWAVFGVALAAGLLAASAEAQVVIRERVELAPPGVLVPGASVAGASPCGGPFDPPCPETFCTLPVTDPVCTSLEIAVTEDGTLALWTERLATRGRLDHPSYTILDPLAGGASPQQPSSQHGLVVRRDGAEHVLTFGVPGTFRLVAEGPDGPDWLRRYDLVTASDRQLAAVELAAGDTLTGVLWTRLPGNRTPDGHPMRHPDYGPELAVGRLWVAVGEHPEFGPHEVLQPSDSSWGAPFTTLAGVFSPREALTLTVVPDTLAPGDSAQVTLGGASGADGTVELSVSPESGASAPGGFVVLEAGPLERRRPAQRGTGGQASAAGVPDVPQPQLSVALESLDRVRFVAHSELGETATATLTAELAGQGARAEVTVEVAADTLIVRMLPDRVTAGQTAAVTVEAEGLADDEAITVLLLDPDVGKLMYDAPGGTQSGDMLSLPLGHIRDGRLAFLTDATTEFVCGQAWVGALSADLSGAGSLSVRNRALQAPPDASRSSACGPSPVTVDLLATQLAYALDGDLLPLFDVDCEQLSRWADVGAHEAPQEVVDRLIHLNEEDNTWWYPGDWEVQELVDALGRLVNMDFYQVRIDLPDGQDDFTFFEEVRVHLDDYLDPTVATFNLYPGDEGRWENGPVVGSVGAFDIAVPGPDERAAVVASLYSQGDQSARWRFSTLWADHLALGHPVSGTREFGVFTDNESGHSYFYTRGVDRVEGVLSSLISEIAHMSPFYEGNPIFEGGDRLWRSFQSRIVSSVVARGGEAELYNPVIFQPRWIDVEHFFERRISLDDLLINIECDL